MSKNDDGCALGFLLRAFLWIMVLALVATWLDRTDGKDFIDSSIEEVHGWYAHADSVWNNDTIKN